MQAHPIIDRFERTWAVIEYSDSFFRFPRVLLPPEAKEGSVLRFDVRVNEEATTERRERIKDLENELFR